LKGTVPLMAADLIGRLRASGGCRYGEPVASASEKANSTPAITAGADGLHETTFPAFRMPHPPAV
jgi:hypothetical protein